MKLTNIPALFFFIFFSGIVVGQSNEQSTYSVVLGDQAIDIGRCAVNVEVEGVGNLDVIAVAPQYAVNFSLDALQVGNKKIKIKGVKKWGVPPNNAPACKVNGEIYLNQLILDEWKPIKDKFAGTPAMRCINVGLNFLGEKIDGSPEASNLYVRVVNPKIKKLFEACDKVIAIELKNNVSCELNAGLGKSLCNEGYYSANDPAGKRLDFNGAVIAAYKGEELKKGSWETKEAESSRLSKIAKQEEERLLRQKERDDREKWLQTAEGKKFLADEEAKRKKEESDRIKAEATENARIAKEFPYVARFTCTTNGYPVNFISCLYGRVNTEIEIQNGQEYKLYQGSEFSNKFPDDKGAKVVNLRSKFSITAQNAAENLILGVKILDRKTGATVFEKQASQFRAIKVSN
jgi:hypothetical protein